MRVKKLKRSLLCFAMVFCIVFSLCGCEEKEISIDDMPEIVFVKFEWFHDELKGEYIDREGYVRNFEIITEGAENKYPDEHDFDSIKRIYEFGEDPDVKFIDELIRKNYEKFRDENILSKASEEEMKSCYKELLEVNTKRKLKIEGYTNLCVSEHWAYVYGKRKDGDNNEEIVFIGGDKIHAYHLETKEKHAKKLFGELENHFTPNNATGFPFFDII